MKLITTFKFIIDIISWLSIGVMIALALFTLSSNGSIFNGYRSFLVLSGSMEPSINIGSIIVVHSQEQYLLRDVITFETEGRIVTHRIADIKNQTYITKGDANRSEDDSQIIKSEIIGKVILIIPFIGRFVAFAQSTPGLIALILFPSLGLFLDQIIRFSDVKRQK